MPGKIWRKSCRFLPKKAVLSALNGLKSEDLSPICGAEFTRRAMPMAVPGGEVELALDLGKVTGSGREAPICEVEIEGKTGEASQWEVFARDFAEKFGLHPQPKSKFRRALALTLEEK